MLLHHQHGSISIEMYYAIFNCIFRQFGEFILSRMHFDLLHGWRLIQQIMYICTYMNLTLFYFYNNCAYLCILSCTRIKVKECDFFDLLYSLVRIIFSKWEYF